MLTNAVHRTLENAPARLHNPRTGESAADDVPAAGDRAKVPLAKTERGDRRGAKG